eukprot:TRINITY_DN14260_c0_g1_i1.p1 TRINITY_DN14260_c0_g1~~TRINITY_DN14260_c0_g1_i1.p1  ORF type:complete len:714 (+),score=161.90 TRINITY_DN14260_c0_g1_i1:45-2186(+)
MFFVSRRNIRLLKLCLVSPFLEKLLLVLYLTSSLLILIFQEYRYTYHGAVTRMRFKSMILASSFQNKVATPDTFFAWLQDDFFNHAMNTPTSNMRLFGAPRLSQWRVRLPAACYKKFDTVTENTPYADYAARYSAACNPSLDDDMLADAMDDEFEPISRTDCAFANCMEFKRNNKDVVTLSTFRNTYPSRAFSIALPSLDVPSYIDTVRKLRRNGWVSVDLTKAITIEFTVIEMVTNTLMHYKFALEMPHAGLMAPYTEYNIITYKDKMDFVTLLFFPVFCGTVFVFSMKIIYEMCVQMSKFAHIGSLICQVLQVASCFLYLAEYSNFWSQFQNKDRFLEFGLADAYVDVDNILILATSQRILMALSIIFYPFRLFSLISWSKYLSFFNKFGSSIYRTFLGQTIYLIYVAALVVGWTMALFVALKNYDERFATFSEALFQFLIADVNIHGNGVQFNDLFSINFYHPAHIYLSAWVIMRLLIYTYCLASLVDSTRKAFYFDIQQLTPQEEESLEYFNEVMRKMEKFSKEHLKELGADQNHIRKRMMVFLGPKHLIDKHEELYDDLWKEDIYIMKFWTAREAIQFLGYLFKLKPHLIYKNKDQFRIVLFVEGYYDDREQSYQADTKHAEVFLEWCKNAGCRADTLLFSNNRLNQDYTLGFRRSFPQLYMSNNSETLRIFSLLESLEGVNHVDYPATYSVLRNDDSAMNLSREQIS